MLGMMSYNKEAHAKYAIDLERLLELEQSIIKGVEDAFITPDSKDYVTIGIIGNLNLNSEEFTYEKGR